jgi:hypothetical protein
VLLDWFPDESELVVGVIEASDVLVARVLSHGAVELGCLINRFPVLGSRDNIGLAPEL